MKGKQNNSAPSEVLVGTRVAPEIRERFKRVADSEHRTVSAVLRRMIEQRIAEAEAELEEAAA